MIERIGQPNIQANLQGNLSQSARPENTETGVSAIAKAGETEKNQALDWKPCST
jgi:hypothetical protein